MIVKYLSNGVWGYIDGVRQVASMDIDTHELMKHYDKENVFENPKDDIASYNNGEHLKDDIIASNKAFTMACSEFTSKFEEPQYGNSHSENLLDGQRVLDNYPASVILLYLNDHKEYETLVFVTNQSTYLMNDKGQTIERLV